MVRRHAPTPPWRVIILLGLLCLAHGAGPAQAQAVSEVGEVAAVVGEATVTRFGGQESGPLAVGAELFEGDRVETASESKLRVTLRDGSTLQLGESTSLTLEWVLHAPAIDQQNVLLSLSSGILRTIVETLLPLAGFRLETTTAVTSVRGTDWIVEAEPDTAAIVALDGRVAVQSAAPGVAGVAVLGPGEGTSVAAGEPPAPVTEWGEARRNDFIARTDVPLP